MFDLTAVKEMWARGWPIMSLLLGCSVLSFAMMLERWVSLGWANFSRESLLRKLRKLFQENRREAALAHCETIRRPIGRVLTAVLEGSTSLDRSGLERLSDRLIRTETVGLHRYLTGLGTIASVSPYIGLLGTVMGIMHAFKSIAQSSAGGPGVVANGIAEALVTTALGLLVAIPAVVGYNLLSRKVERIGEDMELCCEEVIDWVARR